MQFTEIKNGVRCAKGSEGDDEEFDINALEDIELIFKFIMAESGFKPSHRDRVWNHPKDKNLSAQYDPIANKLWVEYKYNSDCLVLNAQSTIEFINTVLSFIRDFYKKQIPSK